MDPNTPQYSVGSQGFLIMFLIWIQESLLRARIMDCYCMGAVPRVYMLRVPKGLAVGLWSLGVSV